MTDGWSERVSVDNVCSSQESAFMTQNGIRKSHSTPVVSLKRHGNLHKHNRTADGAEKIPHSRNETSVDPADCAKLIFQI